MANGFVSRADGLTMRLQPLEGKSPIRGNLLARLMLRAYRSCVRADRLLLARLVGRIRSLVVRWYDPEVIVALPGGELILPLSHDLPFTRLDHPSYGQNLNRTIHCIATTHGGATVVDIGANIGDSVLMSYRSDVRYVCIEAHPDYFDYLVRNTARFENVVRVLAMVGAPGDLLGLAVGRGSASPERCGDGVATATLAEVLDRSVGNGTVDLLKIDTDGYDSSILLSSLDWLNERRPTIFFEYDPNLQAAGSRPVRAVVGDLVDLGYRWILVWDKIGGLIVAVEGDEVMDDLDVYVRQGHQRYYDICMTDNPDLFRQILNAEREAQLVGAR